MPEKTKNIELLVFKFNNGTISDQELQILLDWYNSHDDKKVTIPLKTGSSPDQIKERMWSGLMTKIIADQSPIPVKRLSVWYKIATIAAVLVIAVSTFIFLQPRLATKQAQDAKAIIQPGGNKATLTLANGKTITLSNRQAGIIVGDQITYSDGLPIENIASNEQKEIQQLTLRTPRGGNYNVTLPDGTQVWLNAESSITYPSQFSAAGRVVQMDGEAYFDVKSIYRSNGEKIPFRVIHKDQEIEVLGTQFNINAYPEQATTKTTLVEGRVTISNKNVNVILKPNQQAIVNNGKINVKQVDVNNFIAWREGKFGFDSKTFKETMDEVGRWYDLDIIYADKIPDEPFSGDAFRNQNIGFVLHLLDVAEIDYSLDAKQHKLTIKGKKNKPNT